MRLVTLFLVLFLSFLLPSALAARGGADRSPAPPAPPASQASQAPQTPPTAQTPAGVDDPADDRQAERAQMVAEQIAGRDIRDERVLQAMRKVPRHLFVPAEEQGAAYYDGPLPIGYGQTISQPYIVAFMTETLALKQGDRVLEIGTGSGYQAAVLAEITPHVYTIEIIAPLAKQAAERLAALGYTKVHTMTGDGYFGWEDAAPFDAIIVTAAAGHVPPPLVKQLAPGGRLIIPVGGVYDVQTLVLVTKDSKGAVRPPRELLPVRFVPLTGAGQE